MEHFAGDNDHGNHELYSIIMVVSMAIAASTCVLAILTNNEECQFSRSTTCLGQTFTCVMIMYI